MTRLASSPDDERLTPPPASAGERDARAWLAAATAAPASGAAGMRDATAATGWLLADTVAAIGYAAGLAGAIAAAASSPDAALSAAAPWLLLAVVAALARGACAALAAAAGARASARVRSAVRRQLVRAALSATSSAGPGSGEWMHLAADEVDALDGHVARHGPLQRAAMVAPVLVALAAAFASWPAALLLLATLVPFVVLMAWVGRASAGESARQFDAMARLSGLFADRLRALPVVLAFGAEARETQRLADAARDVATRTMRVLRLAFLSSATLEFFAALSVALVAVYAGFQLLGLLPFPVPDRLDLFRAFFVLALAPEFYLPLRRLAAAYHDRQAAETAASHLAPATVVAAGAPPESGAPRALPRAPRLVLEPLALRPGRDDDRLVRTPGFTVEPGECVALLGPSGSGKTSLLQALLGLVPVVEGGWRVELVAKAPAHAQDLHANGDDVARWSAWVGQSPLVMPGTIAHNLRLAAPDADDAALADAAGQSGLAALLAGRREGLQSRLDARGGGLSGGERRRLAVARALLKRDARIWLMDEPTAHLDATAEDALIDTLRTVTRGRTVLVATHSARVAAMADRVVRVVHVAHLGPMEDAR